MRTAPMGPSNGMPEIIKAAEAALIARMSCGFSWSALKIVPTTWTSLRKPFGNEGRRGRSIRRQIRMAWSESLPSRRKNAPGIFPAAYALLNVDGEGKEVDAFSNGSRGGDCRQQHRVANAGHYGSVGELCEVTGFETRVLRCP